MSNARICFAIAHMRCSRIECAIEERISYEMQTPIKCRYFNLRPISELVCVHPLFFVEYFLELMQKFILHQFFYSYDLFFESHSFVTVEIRNLFAAILQWDTYSNESIDMKYCNEWTGKNGTNKSCVLNCMEPIIFYARVSPSFDFCQEKCKWILIQNVSELC